MPARGSNPTLEDTRAVASVLFHQFAQQRFAQAHQQYPVIGNEIQSTTNYVTDDNDNFQSHNSEQEHHENLMVHNGQTGFIADHQTGNQMNLNGNRLDQDSSQNRTVNDDLNQFNMIDAGLSTPMLANYGRELRRIAEQFEQTRMRQEIRDKAKQVQVNKICREDFLRMLEELFQGGITRERVAILFIFCTDIALRALSFGPELVTTLIGWSLWYIRDRVCLWVQNCGGWDAVLNRYVPSVLVTACAIFGICAFSIYIRKNLWT